MSEFKRISTQDAKELIASGQVTIADIRDEESYAQSRLKGAVHLSNENLQEFVESADPDQPLIVYCYHGHSSVGAANFLCEKGFDDVYSMDGGFEVWRQQFEVES